MPLMACWWGGQAEERICEAEVVSTESSKPEKQRGQALNETKQTIQ